MSIGKYQALLVTMVISLALHGAILVRDDLFYTAQSALKPAQNRTIQLALVKQVRPDRQPKKKPQQAAAKHVKKILAVTSKNLAKAKPAVSEPPSDELPDDRPEEVVEQPEQQQVERAPDVVASEHDMVAQRKKWQLVERRQYMQQLLAHIEKYKFYPGSARRRAMEGDVKLSFMLHSDGELDRLETSGGPSVLQRAAQQAVKDARPLPSPPAAMQLPTRIEISMLYSLQK